MTISNPRKASNRETMHERAASVVRSYSTSDDAVAAAVRLLAPDKPMDIPELHSDISTLMFATLGPGRSSHHMHEILLDLIESGGRHLNEIHRAAMLRACWQNSKFANPVMPDPAETDPLDYLLIGSRIARLIRPPLLSNPGALLVNDEYRDLDFWNALPETLVVWRGCLGIDAKTCASGLGWTTHQWVAHWFAHRLAPKFKPVVVRAEVQKSDIATAFAYEHEVIVRVRDFQEVPARSPRGMGRDWNAVWDGGPWDAGTSTLVLPEAPEPEIVG